MKKKQSQPKATVADFVASIDSELNARESGLDNRESELDLLQNSIAKQREELETDIESFSKEKADFEASSEEVLSKLSKIRSDEKLTRDLRDQASYAKILEKKDKDVTEKLALVEIKLEEVAKRELALSQKESNYKEEIKKEFASNLFKA